MSRINITLARCAPALAVALLVAGCASTSSHKSPQAAAGCRQIQAEIASSEQDKREAAEQQKNAWKAVVPFLVAARYANAKSGVGEADERIENLETQLRRQGCVPHSS